MKSISTILGIILIIAGILIFAYQGFSYTKHENIAQIGDFKITAETQKTISIPPVSGGVSVVTGIILVLIGRKIK